MPGFADVDCDLCKHKMSEHDSDGYGAQWCKRCELKNDHCPHSIARREDLNDRIADLESENAELRKKLDEVNCCQWPDETGRPCLVTRTGLDGHCPTCRRTMPYPTERLDELCKERDALAAELKQAYVDGQHLAQCLHKEEAEKNSLWAELNRRQGDPVTRLHNICESLGEPASCGHELSEYCDHCETCGQCRDAGVGEYATGVIERLQARVGELEKYADVQYGDDVTEDRDFYVRRCAALEAQLRGMMEAINAFPSGSFNDLPDRAPGYAKAIKIWRVKARAALEKATANKKPTQADNAEGLLQANRITPEATTASHKGPRSPDKR